MLLASTDYIILSLDYSIILFLIWAMVFHKHKGIIQKVVCLSFLFVFSSCTKECQKKKLIYKGGMTTIYNDDPDECTGEYKITEIRN